MPCRSFQAWDNTRWRTYSHEDRGAIARFERLSGRLSWAYDYGMDVAAKQLGAFARQASAPEGAARARLGEHGTSPGVNIEPGSTDDGWAIPSPVILEDGTRVQLYKDGEALHAGFDA